MIVVKVELWPQGRPTHVRELGRAFITNISKSPDENIYQVRLDEEGSSYLEIPPLSDDFVLEGHGRKDSVFSLLGRAFSKFVEPQKSTN